MMDDGSCIRCGCAPRNASGLCATCVDEDAVRAGEVDDDASQALWRRTLDQERGPAAHNGISPMTSTQCDMTQDLKDAKACAWDEAIKAEEEAANGVDPEILEGKSEAYVSIYCRARVDAATAIRALMEKEGS